MMFSPRFIGKGFWFRVLSGLVLAGASAAPCSAQAERPVQSAPVDSEDKDPSLASVPLPDLIDEAITITSRRHLSADEHTPWQICHGVLALRDNYYILKDGKPVKALDWIASGPTFKGKPWWLATEHGGKGHPFTKPYHFEGHPNQFLALFTLARLPKDFELKAGEDGEKTITVSDVINNAKMEANDEEEMTWTLWFLAFYIDPDSEWLNNKGEAWSMERLITKQMHTPVTKAACGGMHGLFAIAMARNAHLQAGRALTGTWLEAHIYLQRHIETAKRMQNPDGSFSSNYFKGPGHTDDVSKRLSTTGHTLEMMMGTLPQSELSQTYIQNAARRIATDLIESRKQSLEPGGMYHALNSLMIYRERMWPERAKAKAREAIHPAVQEAATAEKPIR